ncbi:MAG: MFS transporter [Candidatus Omnitrophota bacterium]|nr:MFS transporter [Candidatus Omnitrophota bacterium]
MFASLKVKEYRLYWTGMFVSFIGTWIQITAMSWLIYGLTHSTFLLGLVGFLGSIPIFLFSFFAGAIADRANKRNIILATQIVFMLLALFLATMTQMKLINRWHVMVIAVLNGIVMAFDAPARQAMVVELVGRKNLMNAIALNSAAFSASRMIGPALAGIFISIIGMSGCFYINAVSFLAVIPALLLIKVKRAYQIEQNNSLLQDFKDVILFVKKDQFISAILCITAFLSLFGISYAILMPVFADHILNVGVKGLGVLMSSSGMGALIAALNLARLGDYNHKGKLLVHSAMVFSISLIFFALSRHYLFSIIIMVLVGYSSVNIFSLANTLLQSKVSDGMRGKIMSLFMLTFAGFMPFGSLLAGGLAAKLGASLSVLIGGGVCLVTFLIINFTYPGLRRS